VVTVTLHDGTHIDEADSLAQAIAEARQYWMEEPEGPQAILISGEGCVLAVLMRDQGDPEVCHTMYADGTVEHHRCHYVPDGEGRYDHTDVSELPPLPVPEGWANV
jgi:hypothetical protein